MIDHPVDFFRWNCSVEEYGIPVFLVHVISRLDGFISLAELKSPGGVTFQIDREGSGQQPCEQKDLLPDPEDEDVLAKRHVFLHTRKFVQTVVPDDIDIQGSFLSVPAQRATQSFRPYAKGRRYIPTFAGN
jgi:hypothetical protein